MAGKFAKRLEWRLSAAEQPDAAEQYRAAVADLFDVVIPPASQQRFENHVQGYNLGAAVLTRCRSVPQTFVRTRAQTRRSAYDQVQLIVDISGSADCDYDGRTFRTRPGAARLIDMSRPLHVTTTQFETYNLVVPRAELDGAWAGREVHGAFLAPERAATRLLVEHVERLWREAGALTTEEAVAAVRATMALAAGALAGAGLGADPARPLERGQLSVARDFIDLNLADTGLTPDRLAQHLGLSRRSLYRLFEPFGGVADFIRSRRLDHAFEAIAQGESNGSIAAVAFAHGFASDAHFNRAFKSRYGVPPGEVRGRGAGGTGDGSEDGDAGVEPILKWVRTL